MGFSALLICVLLFLWSTCFCALFIYFVSSDVTFLTFCWIFMSLMVFWCHLSCVLLSDTYVTYGLLMSFFLLSVVGYLCHLWPSDVIFLAFAWYLWHLTICRGWISLWGHCKAAIRCGKLACWLMRSVWWWEKISEYSLELPLNIELNWSFMHSCKK